MRGNGIGGLARRGDNAGALERFRAALEMRQRLAARAPGDAGRARAYAVALQRLAELPGSGVGWAEVAAAWNDMEQRGLLAFPDWQHAAEARRRAEAQKP